jgi:FHA domain/Zinc-ribbon containing domain
MIATSLPSTSALPVERVVPAKRQARREQTMNLLSDRTREGLANAESFSTGSFRCRDCGYVLTLSVEDNLTDCPSCGGSDFARASLFSRTVPSTTEQTARHGGVLASPMPAEHDAQLAAARAQIEGPGEYLCFDEDPDGTTRVVALTREWTRIGRSLAADVRFDDPTVSRRHALVVRQPDGVRVLDDRSLNGVFVNGERVEGKLLQDGDEIVVGRYRLSYLVVAP